MDVSEFRKGKFLKVEDCREPRQARIADCVPGKYGKPDLIFESGDRLGLSATNLDILGNKYGWETEAWIGHVVELAVGQTTFNNENVELVLVKPLSQTDDAAEATPPVRKKPKAIKSQGTDFDDQQPF
jgi:hypothetical protein